MIVHKLQDMTIKQKLTAIIMLTTAAVLLLAATAFVLWDQVDSRRNLVINHSSYAAVLADNCKASLAFSDKEDTEQILSALHADDSIVYACIYDKQGQVFAEYQRSDITRKIQAPEPQNDVHFFEPGCLCVFRRIELDGEIIGTVYLRDDMSTVHSELIWDIVVALIILSIALLIAYFLSSRLQKMVSEPILNLAEVSKVISEQKDYSVRALFHSSGEIGLLIDAFNDMLDQIHQRDSMLVDTKKQLEIKVHDRTEELSSTNAKFENEVTERSDTQETLQKRIKEISCLYSLSKLIERQDISLEQILQETAKLIRSALQDPDNTCVRITFNGIQYKTDNFEKSEFSRYVKIMVGQEKTGNIEVYYLGESPESGQSPFLQEECDLLDAIAQRLGETSQRKKAEHTLRLFRDLVDRSNDSIFVIEPKWGRFLDVNGAACKNLGYEREELLEITVKDINELFPDDSSWTEHVKEVRSKGSMVVESLSKRKDGSTFPVEANIKYISEGKDDYIIAVSRDITERKKAEEKQTKLLEAVESVNKELKDFAHIVSHDLKAPLRGIKTLADWISTDYADKLNDEGKEQLNMLSSRVQRMNNLIDGVLKYSKVGREKVKRVQVNLNELVPEVIDMVAPPENIEITIENDLPVIECEETRILQVFQNLLSNAIKYMDKPQGRISIGCVRENDFWKFSVTDNGLGIEEKHFERIFKIFQTLSAHDDVESTGVGLAVVKKIVELFEGKIWVESKPGEGSTFFFTLPKQEMIVKDEKLEANITC
ncbi:MAG: PAS domain S-box protein [Planctomycetes bacterium]|nr:PAS domain S-box protein [Planctomycetota bacterium]